MEQKENIISIKQHSLIKKVIEYCEKQIANEGFEKIILVGEGKAVNKCISIVEILKRKYQNLKQSTTLDEDPNHPNEPRLTITLSK